MDYFKIITINRKRLIVYKTGEIVFWNTVKNQFYDVNQWCIYKKHINCCGYYAYRLNNKNIREHRIIAYAFLGLDINNTSQQVDHINGIRTDNRLENLRIVNNQQNIWNNTKAKGYYKCGNKFKADIQVDGKKIYLGLYNTEEEARNAYLKAKQIYHIIE